MRVCGVLSETFAEILALSSVLGFFRRLHIKFCFKARLCQSASVTEFPHGEDTGLCFSFYTSSPSLLPRGSVRQSEPADPGGMSPGLAIHWGFLPQRVVWTRSGGWEAGGRLSCWIDKLWVFF